MTGFKNWTQVLVLLATFYTTPTLARDRSGIVIEDLNVLASRRDVIVSLLSRELEVTSTIGSSTGRVGPGPVEQRPTGIKIMVQKPLTVAGFEGIFRKYPALFMKSTDGFWYYTENCNETFVACKGQPLTWTAYMRIGLEEFGPIVQQPVRQ